MSYSDPMRPMFRPEPRLDELVEVFVENDLRPISGLPSTNQGSGDWTEAESSRQRPVNSG